MNQYLKIFTLFVSLLTVTNSKGETPSWAAKQLYLRHLLDQCISETQTWQNRDGSIYYSLNQYKWDDEVEIFYGWTIYYLFTGDEAVYQSVKAIALKYLQRANDWSVHGYYSTPYFDTEHTLEGVGMLGALAYVKPQDPDVVSALEDIVEHVGNWVPGYAKWFDPNTKHLKSLRPGTTRVDSSGESAVDWVFNLGFAKMALAAYYASKDPRYLNWVRDYLDGWIASMERNEIENGYYVIPSEVDPTTGELGPYSGAWYFPAFASGWGWHKNGNKSNRDMRGAFLDYYTFTKDPKYLNALKKQLWTLFDNGSGNIPAHLFNGTYWTAGSDKVTARMAVNASLISPEPDPEFDQFLKNWKFYHRDYWMWDFRSNGNWRAMYAILDDAIKKAKGILEGLRNLQSLPSQPDYFPKIRGLEGISHLAFGGLLANRGEMPWTEVLYYKADDSIGLEPGVAGLVVTGNDSLKEVYLCNTNGQDKIVKLQANFLPKNLAAVTVNDKYYLDFTKQKATIIVPAGQTIRVSLILAESDTIPPKPVSNLRVTQASESSLLLSWTQPTPAEDNDLAAYYTIYRNDVQIARQDSVYLNDSGLRENTNYRYSIYAHDGVGNKSEATELVAKTKADTIPPYIAGVFTPAKNLVRVQYNEPVEEASAAIAGNYSIKPAVNVYGTEVIGKDIVLLSTSDHFENVTYSLNVKNVLDRAVNGNLIDPGKWFNYHFSTKLEITNISQPGYYIASRAVGDSLYNDRPYLITEIPLLFSNFKWIVTSNNDKREVGAEFLAFSINRPATVVIGYDVSWLDNHSPPGWLSGWERTSLIIKSNDTSFLCFLKRFSATRIVLGGNQADDSSSMYLVLVDPATDILAPKPPTGLAISNK